jgi:hypothetical protein
MASLLSASEKTAFKAALDDLFDTFKQDIIIYKEAKIQLIDINQPRIFGYNERIDISNINYAPVTGVFPALVNANKNQDQERLDEAGNFLAKGQVTIKIKPDAYNYINNNGTTLNIAIGDDMYKIVSTASARRFISPDYYIYILERER